MDSPSSSTTSDFSSPEPSKIARICSKNLGNCEVCGREGHGKHFGAITCRACAAFFRRFGISNNFKPCKKNGKCGVPKSNGWFCKQCRVQKCRDIGMNSKNFQYDRDVHRPEKAVAVKLDKKIPQTMDTFLGRSNLIILCAPPPDAYDSRSKPMIDVRFLIDKATDILRQGPETPIFVPNCLEKLSLGLQRIRGRPLGKTKVITKVGKDEVFALWEDDMLKVARWFTYFDEFQMLPSKLQLDMLKGLWNVFGRLEKVATTAIARQQKLCGESMLMAYVEKDVVVCDIKNLEVDLSWCSRYTFEQLKFFDSHDHEKQLDILIQLILELQPTDVELSYMLCQLCFHQVGKKYQGEILEVTDRFQEILSNHLHDYYVNNRQQVKYANRISNMMKINNIIQQCIYRDRVKSELMKVFDVFYVKCSHPDLFINS